MEELVLHKEKENRRFGFIISIAVHILLFLLLLIPCLSYFDPPLELEGIMVVFGDVDAGEPLSQSSENSQKSAVKPTPAIDKPEPQKTSLQKTVIVPETIKKEEVESKLSEEESPVKISETKPQKEEKSTEMSEAASAVKQQEETEAYEKAKSKFGSLFGKSDQEPTGNNSGSKGDPLGRPDAEALEGISKGSGRVGGGLSNRGLLYEPNFKDTSQKSGIVVVKICVNEKGNVISSKYTQKGSTTTDSYLVSLAEKEAGNYKFSSSTIEEQCGTITVDFKVK